MRFSELELIAIQAEVLFVHNQVGRIKSVNEQGNPKAPRFFLSKTREGNITRYHYKLHGEMISKIEKLIRECSNHIEIAKIIKVLNEERTVENWRIFGWVLLSCSLIIYISQLERYK